MLPLLLLTFASSVLAQECATDPEIWGQALLAAFNGGPFVCADPNLMIRFEALKSDENPVALNKFNSFWTWASDKQSLDYYMENARSSGGNTEQFVLETMKFLGITPVAVDPAKKYKFTVFKKDEVAAHSPFDPFQPTWQNLFEYLYNFEACKWAPGTEDKCEVDPWSIEFSDVVQYSLTSQTASAVTGCQKDLNCKVDPTCSPEFCQMTKDLEAARDDTTADPAGVLNAALQYMNFQNNQELFDDQARAFFNTVMGASWLFTGNGNSNNGEMDTNPEFLVRGDVPLEYIGGVRVQVHPQ